MKKFILAALLIVCPFFGLSQATTGYHRVSQVLARSNGGVKAEVVPYATVVVTSASTGSAATIYSDPGLSSPISGATVTADPNGNYDYYMALGYCVNEAISSPSQGSQTVSNVCSNGSFNGGGTINGSLTVGALTAVALSNAGTPTGTPSTTGGTVAAGSNYAYIVAIDAAGNHTAATNESALVTTTGSTSSITWAWAVVTNAVSYQIWVGSTSGGESSYFASNTNSYVQTLPISSGTSGTLPTANTTGSITTTGTVNAGTVAATNGITSGGSCPLGALPGSICSNGSVVGTVGMVDPVSIYNGAGVITTTTGSISSGNNALTVVSASGWLVGMGIAVHGAGGGGAELITTVSNILGNTFTLAASASTTVSGATVNHDDTLAIQAAINSGSNVYLRPGNYNVTSDLSVTNAISIIGAGAGTTTIWNRSATNHVFSVNYTAPTGTSTQYSNGPILEDFQIYQSSSITPTAGYGIYTTSSSGFRYRNIAMNGLWGGVYMDTGEIVGWVEDLRIDNLIGGYGIYYNVPAPGGDLHFDNDELSGTNTGVFIQNSDTTEFTNLKTNNGSKVTFGTGSINNIRFINPSVEGVATCAFDFSSTGTYGNVIIIGGEFESTANQPFCSPANVVSLTSLGFINGNVGQGGNTNPINQTPNLATVAQAEGASNLPLYYGQAITADLMGSILAVGPSSPVSVWPNNSAVIEGQNTGGTVLSTETNVPILFTPDRMQTAVFSGGSFGVGSSTTPSSNPFYVTPAGAVSVYTMTASNGSSFTSPAEGASASAYLYGGTQEGSIYAIGGSSPVGAWPNHSIVVESANASGGGLVLDTINSSPVLIAPNRTLALTISPDGAVTPTAARRGTFTCTAGGNISISNSNFVTGSDVTVTMETSGGTPAQPFMNTPSSGSGFKEQCGASDTSTYRYTIWN